MAGSIPESPAACNKLFHISSVDSSLRNWGTTTLGSKNNGSSGPGSADPCDALRALADLLRRTSDQLVHSRKQKLEDRRLVRLSVAEDQIDSWRISLQRAARYRRGEKVLCVSR